jgi:hypothetical protein
VHKGRFGQAHCIDLHKRISKNFSLHFLRFILFSTNFRILTEFPGILIRKRNSEIDKLRNRSGPRFGLRLQPMAAATCHARPTENSKWALA